MAQNSRSDGQSSAADGGSENPLKARAEAQKAARKGAKAKAGRTGGAPKSAAHARANAARSGGGRALALAWGLSLALVAGGAVALQLSYAPNPEPAAPSADETAAEASAPTAQAPAADPAAAPDAGSGGPQDPADGAGEDGTEPAATAEPDEPSVSDETQADGTSQEADAGNDGPDPSPRADGQGDMGVEASSDQDARVPAFDAAPFPDPKYLDTGRYEGLPRVADNTSTPFERYSKTRTAVDQPAVAVVVTKLGLKAQVSQQAIESLPAAVTFALSPYAQDPQKWADRAHADGHELLLMVPMEPQDYPRNDPGPDTLKVEAATAENIQSLHAVMDAFGGYMGVINHMGSRFTASRDAVRPILKEVGSRGLMFLDARVTSYSAAGRMAKEFAMPYAVNNRFIDATVSADAIDDKFADLATIAKNNGVAVGIAEPLPVTLERIQYWRGRLAADGVALVPLSAVSGRQNVQ